MLVPTSDKPVTIRVGGDGVGATLYRLLDGRTLLCIHSAMDRSDRERYCEFACDCRYAGSYRADDEATLHLPCEPDIVLGSYPDGTSFPITPV